MKPATQAPHERDFDPGVAEWLGWAEARGESIPRDFVWFLINAPAPLSFEACVTAHMLARGWS